MVHKATRQSITIRMKQSVGNKLLGAEMIALRHLKGFLAAKRSLILRWSTYREKERSWGNAHFIQRQTSNRRFWSNVKTWTTKIKI